MANEDGRLISSIPCAIAIGICLLVSMVLAGGIIFYFLAVMNVFYSGFSSEEDYAEKWEEVLSYAPQSLAAQWTPDGNHMLLPSERGIYSITSADSSPPRRVVQLDGGASWLSISPSGLRIAYVTTRDYQRLPYYTESSNLDGTDRRQITEKALEGAHGLSEAAPAWSPDGQHIALARFRRGALEGRGIYIMDADGSNQRRVYSFRPDLPDRASVEGYRWGPVWSPDGRELAFVVWEKISSSERRDVLYRVRVNDLAATQVYVTRPGTIVHSDRLFRMDSIISPPSWSPNGNRLAFIRRNLDSIREKGLKAGTEIKLHTISPDGSELRTVAEGSAFDFDFSFGLNHGFFRSLLWSPHGTELLFASSSGVYIASEDVGGYRKIAEGEYASWSPDGTRIAVTHHEYDGTIHDLSTMAPDGSDMQILLEGTSR